MILSLIFHVLKTALGYAIKFIAWLLVSLSLWVPLLYTVIFVIAVAVSGGSLAQLKVWFLLGLILSFIGSFTISTFLFERRIKKKKQQKSMANVAKAAPKQTEFGVVKRDENAAVSDMPVPNLTGANTLNRAGHIDSQNANNQNPYNQNGQINQNAMYGGQIANNQFDYQGQHADYQGNQAGKQPYQSGIASANTNTSPNLNQNNQAGYDSNHPYYHAKAEFTDGYNSGFMAGFNAKAGKGDTALKHNFFAYDALNKNSYSDDFGQGIKDFSKDDESGGFDNSTGFNRTGYARKSFYESNSNEEAYNNNDNQVPHTAQDESSGYSNQNAYYKSYNSQNDDGFSPTTSADMPQGGLNHASPAYTSPVSNAASDDESPKVFALRSDPTVFVYEYFDRLEYYKRTRAGMVLMNTKYKNIS